MTVRPVWLLVDCNYLSWRAFHSTGSLAFGGDPTGVAFGVLRDLELLADLWGPERTVLAWDSRTSRRRDRFPGYKVSRTKERPPEETEARTKCYQEMDRLRETLLPNAGYRNVWTVDGYEADDLIAGVATGLPLYTDAIVASSDADLWQVVGPTVTWYSPASHKVVTESTFIRDWGIQPSQWAEVKALAGCSTDDIPGVRGIGEKTAAKYVAGTLKSTAKAFAAITEERDAMLERNLPLVTLPFPGLVLPPVVPDLLSPERMRDVRASLGIRGRPLVGFV